MLSTIAASRAEDSVRDGTVLSQALVDGFSSAFLVGAAIAAVGVVTSLLIRRDELEAEQLLTVDPAVALEAV